MPALTLLLTAFALLTSQLIASSLALTTLALLLTATSLWIDLTWLPILAATSLQILLATLTLLATLQAESPFFDILRASLMHAESACGHAFLVVQYAVAVGIKILHDLIPIRTLHLALPLLLTALTALALLA